MPPRKTSNLPAAISTSVRTGGARFNASRDGSTVRVAHREMVIDLQSSANWFIYFNAFINPGNALLFPWLHVIASRYETYRFHSLKFIYRSMTGTSTNGEIEMAIDYDAADAPPHDKPRMLSYEGAIAASIWSAAECVASPTALAKLKNKFVSTVYVAPPKDVLLYHAGRFYFAADGGPDAFKCGELFVEYDIELSTPQLEVDATDTLLDFTVITSPGAAFDHTHFNEGYDSDLYSFGIGDGLPGNQYMQFNAPGNYISVAGVLSSTGANATVNPPTVALVSGAGTVSNNGFTTTIASGVSSGNVANLHSQVYHIQAAPALFTIDYTPCIGGNINVGTKLRFLQLSETST